MLTDLEFFERYPERRYRLRMCTQEEIDYPIAKGARPPDSEEFAYVAIADAGRKFRRMFFQDIYSPTKADLESEDVARSMFEEADKSGGDDGQ